MQWVVSTMYTGLLFRRVGRKQTERSQKAVVATTAEIAPQKCLDPVESTRNHLEAYGIR